jgi:hypothetical protein
MAALPAGRPRVGHRKPTDACAAAADRHERDDQRASGRT